MCSTARNLSPLQRNPPSYIYFQRKYNCKEYVMDGSKIQRFHYWVAMRIRGIFLKSQTKIIQIVDKVS